MNPKKKEREVRKTIFIEKEANLEFKILSPPKGRHTHTHFCTLPNFPSLSSKLLSFHRNQYILPTPFSFMLQTYACFPVKISPMKYSWVYFSPKYAVILSNGFLILSHFRNLAEG